MKSKRTYRSINVQQVKVASLLAQLPAKRVLVGMDVAKQDMVAVFGGEAGETAQRVRFEHPVQSREFLSLLEAVKEAGKQVEVALEPTGTYGDALRYQMWQRGMAIYMVNPKKTHDAAELFDGVPSQHDSKDATVVLRLHAQGLSRSWSPAEPERRELRAYVTRRESYAQMQGRLCNQLEALLARHWPELGALLPVRNRTTGLQLLAAYPAAEQVQAHAEAVLELLRKSSRGKVSRAVGEQVIQGAQDTLGVPPTEAEGELMADLAQQVLGLGQKIAQMDTQLRELMSRRESRRGVVEMVGSTTSAVLYALLGELGDYPSAGALEKACGLNLKENSSGYYESPLHITKRGPGQVRKYLYLATLRWIHQDPIACAWYQRRSGYREESKQRAVIALMRKLVKALWHVAKGKRYQASQLFDVRRLKLSAQGQHGGATTPAPCESGSAPPQSAPPQTTPPQSTPPQSAPPQSAPSQSAPSQSVPSQSAPPQSVPSQSAAKIALAEIPQRDRQRKQPNGFTMGRSAAGSAGRPGGSVVARQEGEPRQRS
jgi:transposase